MNSISNKTLNSNSTIPSLTIEEACSLSHEISEIWQKIDWTESPYNEGCYFQRCLNDEETTKIKSLKNYVISQKRNQVIPTSELSKLEDFTIECTRRLCLYQEKLEKIIYEAKCLALRQPLTPELITNYVDLGISQTKRVEIAKNAAMKYGLVLAEHIKLFKITDSQSLFEIAKIIASDSETRISRDIHNFGLTNPNQLFEIAEISAKNNGKDTTNWIENYHFQDQAQIFAIGRIAATCGECSSHFIKNYQNKIQLFEIAKIHASRRNSTICTKIQIYNILDQKQLFELAKSIAISNPIDLCIYIRQFNIQDEANRITLAKITAAETSYIAEYFQNFDIKDHYEIFKIAMIAALNQKPWLTHNDGISKSIQNLGIKDPDKLFEIAKAAASDSSSISKFISNYNLNSIQKIEIAKIAANQKNTEISLYIQNYEIKEKAKLIEIAKIAAKNNGGSVSYNIGKYGIQNNLELFEIAKIAAANNGTDASYNITNFGLSDPKQLYEIALIAATEKHGGLGSNIKKFGFKDQAILFEIAKISAANSGTCTSECIQNFGLENPEKLFVIAKIAAAHDGEETSALIQYYKITNQEHLYEVAKIAAANHGEGTSLHIENYGINNTLWRFKIAKIAAENNAMGFCKYIEKYHLEIEYRYELAKIVVWKTNYFSSSLENFELHDSEQLFELAKVAAAKDGASTSFFIENYKIKDPQKIFEIAKIAAANSGEGISKNFKKYSISDQDKRFEIAMIAAKQDSGNTSFYIDNYQINNQLLRFEIAKFAFLNGQPNDFIYQYLLTFSQELEIFMQCCEKAPENIPDLLKLFKFEGHDEFEFIPYTGFQLMNAPEKPLSSLSIADQARLGPLMKYENIPLSEANRKNLHIWIGYYLLNCQYYEIKEKDNFHKCQKEIDSTSLLQAIAKLRNPAKRFQLTALLFKQVLMISQTGSSLYIYAKMKKSTSFSHKDAPILRLLLSPLISAYWTPSGSAWENTVISTLVLSPYKDATAQNAVIDSLYTLINAPHLTMNEKALLVLEIFGLGKGIDEKKKKTKIINRNLRLMEAIIQSGHSDLLKQFVSLRPRARSLSALSFQECLKKIFYNFIGKVQIKNFGKKFEKIFLNARQPFAFFTYASKLQSLSDQSKADLQRHLQKVFITIVEESFHDLRYEEGSHLATVFSSKIGLKEEWKKGSSITLIDINHSGNEGNQGIHSEKEGTIKKYLQDRICRDNHIPTADYPTLVQFLKTEISNQKDLTIYLQQLAKQRSEFENELEKNDQKQKIDLQIALISLFNLQKSESEKLTCLKYAKELVPKTNMQFLQDLQDLEELINPVDQDQQCKSSDKWSVHETDAWEDLLLCGTDVLGSCQNINNDPNYNKCLLNYLLDGKNRLAVLKDANGLIRARVVLRLLWDNTMKQPVLYRERLYTTPGVSQEALKSLGDMCKRKAKNLGIPLVKTKEFSSEGELYPNSLESLNGVAPFEYVDASQLGITNGIFTLPANNIEIITSAGLQCLWY